MLPCLYVLRCYPCAFDGGDVCQTHLSRVKRELSQRTIFKPREILKKSTGRHRAEKSKVSTRGLTFVVDLQLARKAPGFANHNQKTNAKEDGERRWRRWSSRADYDASDSYANVPGGRVTRSAKECEPIVNVPPSEFPWKVDALAESIIRMESLRPSLEGICY